MSFNQVSVRRSNVRMYVGMVGKTTLLALARYFEKSLMKILRNLVRYLALPFALFLSILMRNITKILARFREILCHLILDGTVVGATVSDLGLPWDLLAEIDFLV